jgi:hypothetical protein
MGPGKISNPVTGGCNLTFHKKSNRRSQST